MIGGLIRDEIPVVFAAVHHRGDAGELLEDIPERLFIRITDPEHHVIHIITGIL